MKDKFKFQNISKNEKKCQQYTKSNRFFRCPVFRSTPVFVGHFDTNFRTFSRRSCQRRKCTVENSFATTISRKIDHFRRRNFESKHYKAIDLFQTNMYNMQLSGIVRPYFQSGWSKHNLIKTSVHFHRTRIQSDFMNGF